MPSVIRCMTVNLQLHNSTSSRSRPRQAQPSPKCRHSTTRLLNLYWSYKKTWMIKQVTVCRTKLGPGSNPAPVSRVMSLQLPTAGKVSGKRLHRKERLAHFPRCITVLPSDSFPRAEHLCQNGTGSQTYVKTYGHSFSSLSFGLLLSLWTSHRGALRIWYFACVQKCTSSVSPLAARSKMQLFWTARVQYNLPYNYQERQATYRPWEIYP